MRTLIAIVVLMGILATPLSLIAEVRQDYYHGSQVQDRASYTRTPRKFSIEWSGRDNSSHYDINYGSSKDTATPQLHHSR